VIKSLEKIIMIKFLNL